MSKDKLINNVIKELNIDSEVNHSIIEMIIQSDFEIKKSKQKLGCQIYFYLPNISKTDIDIVYKEAVKILKKKKDVVNKNYLFENIITGLKKDISITFIDSSLELFDDIVY